MLNFYLNLALSDEDRGIIDEIYKNYYADMFRMAYKFICDRDISADIVHETMLKIISIFNEHGSDRIKSLKTYVLVAVKYTAIDYLRTNSKTENHDDISEHWDIADNEPLLIDIVISNESFNQLVSYIRNLPDTYRDACYLKYVCALDDCRIADTLRISRATVAMRIHRGKKLLQKKILEVKSLEK